MDTSEKKSFIKISFLKVLFLLGSKEKTLTFFFFLFEREIELCQPPISSILELDFNFVKLTKLL